MAQLAQHYPDHVARVRSAFDRALDRSGFDEVVVDAGRPRTAFLDDQDYPFIANPLFAWWLPLTTNPWCLIHYAPGDKPTLVYHQPTDYWHQTPEAPAGFWVDHFDVRPVADAAARGNALPAATARVSRRVGRGRRHTGLRQCESRRPGCLAARRPHGQVGL